MYRKDLTVELLPVRKAETIFKLYIYAFFLILKCISQSKF